MEDAAVPVSDEEDPGDAACNTGVEGVTRQHVDFDLAAGETHHADEPGRRSQGAPQDTEDVEILGEPVRQVVRPAPQHQLRNTNTALGPNAAPGAARSGE